MVRIMMITMILIYIYIYTHVAISYTIHYTMIIYNTYSLMYYNVHCQDPSLKPSDVCVRSHTTLFSVQLAGFPKGTCNGNHNMYVYIYIYMYTCVYIYIYIYTFIYTYIHTYVIH